ncbi:hypothetical protein SOP91_00235 (plasmid) [Enterobacter hormaechei]|uniref:hypothetical protein n=1 Tax=Enterobacter hormaechei TaxID=158836 RepID=UPI002B4BC860|nr:hypothetical protein [Enterobacter hormaechei]WRM07059.1 hypothetical protein SOP91_00235 [Enterobacter hormaechei]
MTIKILTTESIAVISFFDLNDDQQAEQVETFGQESAEDGNYFIYADQVYAMADCIREEPHTEAGAAGWHGSFSETAFSRLLVKLVDDNDAVILAREC